MPEQRADWVCPTCERPIPDGDALDVCEDDFGNVKHIACAQDDLPCNRCGYIGHGCWCSIRPGVGEVDNPKPAMVSLVDRPPSRQYTYSDI